MAAPITFEVGEPPRDPTRQYLVWAYDNHGDGHGQRGHIPRWCIAQWRHEMGSGYWAWSVPGLVTSVTILRHAELPELDHWAEASLTRTRHELARKEEA